MGIWSKISASLKGSPKVPSALSGKTWRLNPKREVLFRFDKVSDVEKFEFYSDNEVGGKSTGFLDLSQDRKFATFHGNISLELPQNPVNNMRVTKTGMVAIRAAMPFYIPPESAYDSFVLTARGDGSFFLVNATVFNSQGNKEVLQAAFQSPTEWSDITIPFRCFIPSWNNNGMVSMARGLDTSSMELTHLGIMMSQRKEGPFKLDIHEILVVDSKSTEKRPFAFDN